MFLIEVGELNTSSDAGDLDVTRWIAIPAQKISGRSLGLGGYAKPKTTACVEPERSKHVLSNAGVKRRRSRPP